MLPVSGVEVGALGELIATAVTAASGRAWKAARGKPEGRAVHSAISAAVRSALLDSSLGPDALADEEWVEEVAKVWRSALPADVVAKLVGCLADPTGDSEGRFAQLARRALETSGCDLGELGRTFWVEEFLYVLPRYLLAGLRGASLEDERVRGLVGHLLQQRADARAGAAGPASPREFREDVIALLRRLGDQACAGRLPAYLAGHRDVGALTRTVRVRHGIRSSLVSVSARADPKELRSGRAYELPSERSHSSGMPEPWSEVAAKHRRLVVLADPGLGKSWLVRSETQRLCDDALSRSDPEAGLIPIPLRCDQLAAADGGDLAERAAAYLVARRFLPGRSSAHLAHKARRGQVVLLLDALDELTAADSGPLRELVRSWAEDLGDRARYVITSRIAGYTGAPSAGAYEVELQPFTSGDITAVVHAWGMSPRSASRLLDLTRDPAVAAMAQIPLLLALLCSLAAELPLGEALPRTRGQLYDRVLRRFLTREHRSSDNVATRTLDDIEVGAFLDILAPVAFTFAMQSTGWADLMPREQLLSAIRASGPGVHGTWPARRRDPQGTVDRRRCFGP